MTGGSLPPLGKGERQYRILIELGRGGTSDVYLAVVDGSAGFNKLVVLKALKPEIARDRAARRLFLSEARLSARLNHPNVVQVNEVIEQEGIPIIVMEYLEGSSLAEILDRGRDRLPLALHLRVLSDALRGLHYSHELCDYDGTPLEVVHRNMSPHNVFVTFAGQVKVLDFGLARIAGTADTKSGLLRGRVHYIAPDQLAEDGVLDRRADVYTVGVMLWEAATGQRLWTDLSEPVIARRVLAGGISLPSTVSPRVPAELERVCMRALARRPEDRHATAAELANDIDAIAASLGEPGDVRALAEAMTREFGEIRRARDREIEAKLAADGRATGAFAQRPAGAGSRDARDSIGEFCDPTRSVSNLPKRRRRRTRGLWLAAAALAAITAAAVWLARGAGAGPAAIASRDLAPPPPPPASAQLRITAFPAAARVLIDGRETGENPCAREVRAGAEVSLRVEAPGHLPIERSLHVTRDQELVLSLRSVPPTVTAAVTAKPPVMVRAPSPPPPSPVANIDCTPPYYLDARGVKKFKPECL